MILGLPRLVRVTTPLRPWPCSNLSRPGGLPEDGTGVAPASHERSPRAADAHRLAGSPTHALYSLSYPTGSGVPDASGAEPACTGGFWAPASHVVRTGVEPARRTVVLFARYRGSQRVRAFGRYQTLGNCGIAPLGAYPTPESHRLPTTSHHCCPPAPRRWNPAPAGLEPIGPYVGG